MRPSVVSALTRQKNFRWWQRWRRCCHAIGNNSFDIWRVNCPFWACLPANHLAYLPAKQLPNWGVANYPANLPAMMYTAINWTFREVLLLLVVIIYVHEPPRCHDFQKATNLLPSQSRNAWAWKLHRVRIVLSDVLKLNCPTKSNCVVRQVEIGSSDEFELLCRTN